MDTLLDDIDWSDIGNIDSASDNMDYFQNHLFQIFDQLPMLPFLLRKSAILYWKSGEAIKEKVYTKEYTKHRKSKKFLDIQTKSEIRDCHPLGLSLYFSL